MRRGIVLGAGGVLGAAWQVGSLVALVEEAGIDPQHAQVLLGTSAGAVNAALLAAGLPPHALLAHHRGDPLEEYPYVDYDHDAATGSARPPRPTLRAGSPSLLRRGALRPGRMRPLVTFAGLLPRGRGSHDALRAAIRAVLGDREWPEDGRLRVVALDYATGERVVFGTPGAPRASAADAVAASCSIPGWYTPVMIDGREYIDGGPRSSTSVDLLADDGLDEVVVLAPTASLRYDRPRDLASRLERRWRRHVTALLARDVRRLQATGVRVRVLTPGPSDLAVIGGNLMDPEPRLRVLETSLRTSAEVARTWAATG